MTGGRRTPFTDNGSQNVAIPESTISDGGDGAPNSDGGQAAADGKSICSDGGNGVANGDGGQTSAI